MRVSFAVGAVSIALLLTGCASDRMDDIDTGTKPQPLEAQPVQPVQSNDLPDPSTSTDSSQFPQKPTTDQTLSQNQNANANMQVAANAQDIKKESLVGGWKVNNGGATCDMFLTLTNLGSGSRGGTRGCVGPLASMGSWEVDGKQVTMKDRDGNPLARFYKTADNRLDGALTSGQTVSLSR